ncbi:hypothetical protein [Streptomyces sp. V1I1]|uniref:aromatic-ring hydroxylase C-terminal domain-containing protein n=1 Tax=Streptomyces sp. V1I1 TaxID=3042272 RepID=UPI00358F32C2
MQGVRPGRVRAGEDAGAVAVGEQRCTHRSGQAGTNHDEHADLHGVTEVLVRPDGHIAWATRATDADVRSSERTAALAAWAGAPAGGDAS